MLLPSERFFQHTDRDVVLVPSACFTPRLREPRGPNSAACSSETKLETTALLDVRLQLLLGTASQPERCWARNGVCPAFRCWQILLANLRLIGRRRRQVISLGCGAEARLEHREAPRQQGRHQAGCEGSGAWCGHTERNAARRARFCLSAPGGGKRRQRVRNQGTARGLSTSRAMAPRT